MQSPAETNETAISIGRSRKQGSTVMKNVHRLFMTCVTRCAQTRERRFRRAELRTPAPAILMKSRGLPHPLSSTSSSPPPKVQPVVVEV